MTNNQLLKQFERLFKKEASFAFGGKLLNKYIGIKIYEPDRLAIRKTLTEPLSSFLAGNGKRIRPRFFFLLLEIFKINPSKYLGIGVVLELLHNATLIIDDIEDNSELRRGKPTIHKVYGVDVALNAGVALHILPLHIIYTDKNLNSKQKLRLWKIYMEEISRVYFGQATDISWHKYGTDKITLDNYLEMCRLKTGALMRMSVRMACAIANKNQETETQLARFSEKMGISFQIKDDLLDNEGDVGTFGKTFGNDITEGKISLPVVFALEELPILKNKELSSILLKHTKNKIEIKQALSLIKKTNAIDRAKKQAEKLYNDAWKDLSEMRLTEKDREKLKEFTSSFIHRNK